MSIFDKLSERVGDFLGEVLLPEDVRQSHERATRAMKRGEYRIALLALEDAERQRPNLERTRHLMGQCYFYEKEFEKAARHFSEAIALREEPASHFYRGLALEELGDLHDAQVHFHRALTLAHKPPYEFDLYFALGRIYLAQRRADKAIRELRKALRIWPGEVDAALTLIEALLERDRIEEARDVMREIKGEEPSTRALLLRARIEETLGEHRAARGAYEEVVKREQENREALMGAARNALETNDHARANEYLLRALQGAQGRERSDILVLLGRLNEAVGNEARALESFESALELTPRHLEASLGAGRLILEKGDYDEAAAHFRRILEAGETPWTRDALIGLSRCRLRLGDTAGARHLLEEADQLGEGPDGEILHGLGLVALHARDPAEAVVALQEARQAAISASLSERIEADLHRALEDLRPQWRLPKTFDNATELVTTLEGLKEWMAPDPRLSEFLPTVQELIRRMDAPLSIAIVGEFNAGKSTLVNAILGEEVVPMGVLPTTAHTCIMQYGPRRAARVVYTDDRVIEASFDEARRLMREESEAITRLDYLYPHPDLRSVHFWDTPGFNALDERHEETAAWALERGEAILWVLDAGQVLSQTEFERIESLSDGKERLIVVINKIDRLGPAGSRQEEIDALVEYVDDHAGELIAGIFPISALQTLEGRTGKADHSPQETGFDALWSFLDERIMQRSGRIKVLEVGRGLENLLGELEDFASGLVEDYQRLTRLSDDLGDWLNTLAAHHPEDRAKREALELADQIEFVLTGVEREVHEALKPRGTWITKMILSDEDRAFILDLMRERFHSVLDRARQNITAELVSLETELANRMSAILNELSVGNARALNRRLEGFFDETRVLKMVLVERVYGRLEARAHGQIEAGGRNVLQQVEALGEGDRKARQALLRELLPGVDGAFEDALESWYTEFFLAARRFCDRLGRDLSLLELEAQYRYDVGTIRS